MLRRLVIFAALAGLALGAGVRHLENARGAALPVRTPAPQPTPRLDQSDKHTTPPPEQTDGRSRWQRLWTRAVPGCRALSLAPDGNVAWLGSNGSIRRIEPEQGTTVFQSSPLARATQLVAVTGGRVLAFAPFNTATTKVWKLDAQTGRADAFDTDGPVWSVGASLDGQWAFLGTGRRTVQQVALTPSATRRSMEPVGLCGIPEFLAVSADGTTVLAGLWQLSGVQALRGWTHTDADAARWQEVTLAADGSTVAVLSGHGPRRLERDLRLTVFDGASGLTLWERWILGSAAHIKVSADGQRVALSYANARGHRLAVYQRDGTPIGEEKGGSFFDPTLVALSPLGERMTVLDSDRALFTLDTHGRTLSRQPFPIDPKTGVAPRVVGAQSTPDGAYLLLQRGDGTIALYRSTD